MSPASASGVERLRAIRAWPEMLRYFIDELRWPLEDESLLEGEDLEDLTYDWDLTEFGIRDTTSPIRHVHQLRPFTADQPWGIFFVELAGQRLLITQLRRLLSKLVARKRESGSGANRSWRLDDLLFVVMTGSGDSIELNLLAFFRIDGRTEFRCLPWRPAGSSSRHLHRLHEELLPSLMWPDDEDDVAAWRSAWRKPFTLRPGQTIRSAVRLAERMSRTARDLREQIGEALDIEDGTGPFSDLLNDVRRHLIADVNADRFADMCAQTLVYGLLGSRVTDPEGFGASPVLSVVPLANPFLDAFFEKVHGEAVALDVDLEGSGLEHLAADLRVTDVEAILDQFGTTAKGADPVIHFYEEFLKRYDRKMRANAGAFYTPVPVVDFMVRGVDELLKSRFGLEAGIADRATWQQVSERVGFHMPEGIDPDEPFVSMVDPATGTGTFLVRWLEQAKRSFSAAEPDGNWRQHLGEVVLPAMHAFELMLAPYTIAHLKLALHLHDEGVDTNAAQVLLTDALDHDPPQLSLHLVDDPIAVEGRRAADLKQSRRFTVVIGNPPYDREQRAAGDTGKRKGGVVRHGAQSFEPLIEAVITPMKQAGLGGHVKNLYNDYVYFWRWATWQATELPPGPGVVSFITAASYLDGVSMGGLRSLLRDSFDEIIVIDLGGEGRGAIVEDNVFDIRTPVAIAFGVRRSVSEPVGSVRYLRVSGSRQQKLKKLASLPVRDVDVSVAGSGIESFVPRSDSEYLLSPPITDLFPWIRSGCKFQRTWPVGETKQVLTERWRNLVAAVPRRRGLMLREKDRTIFSNPTPLLSRDAPLTPIRELDRDAQPEGTTLYGYRSFDRQWVIADNRLAGRPGPVLWSIRSASQMYLTSLTSTKFGRGPVLTVTPYVPDFDHFSGRGARNVMPLYRDRAATEPNLPADLLQALDDRLGRSVTVEDLAAYAHALLGTGAFSERFAEELAEAAGPVHVPITADPDLFDRAVHLGRDLLWRHTWGERYAPAGNPPLPAGSAREVSPVVGYPEKFTHDADAELLEVGTGRFAPVTEEIWNFQVSGLKVLRSWLGYRMAKRKGRKSSPLDDIRPRTWTFTPELLRLLAILEHTIAVTPTAAQLLDVIVSGPLIPAADLPQPTEAERKPPRV